MPNRFRKYWGSEELSVRTAALFNLRDNDLRAGGPIRRGEIIAGKCGYCVAEADVPHFTGSVVVYAPNRCVDWQGYFLTGMALPGLPADAALRGMAGNFRHQHYVVAELSGSKMIAQARKLGLPVIRSREGRVLANLEIFSVPGHTRPYRRAKLL